MTYFPRATTPDQAPSRYFRPQQSYSPAQPPRHRGTLEVVALSHGAVRIGSATLEITSDALLVKTFSTRLLLPAGGIRVSSLHAAPCFEHVDSGEECARLQAQSESTHVPKPGYACTATDGNGQSVVFGVPDRGTTEAFVARSLTAPGPRRAVGWQSLGGRFATALATLWLFGSMLLFGAGLWDSAHLERTWATVTLNEPDVDGRYCEVSLTDRAGQSYSNEPLPCSAANERGTQVEVWWSTKWEVAASGLADLVWISAVWKPLARSAALAGAMLAVGAIGSVWVLPLSQAYDRRRIRDSDG